MPSFLSRLRNRATSQSSAQSSPSQVEALTPRDDAQVFTPVTQFIPIDRKIRPDLNALLESYAAEAEISEEINSSTDYWQIQRELGVSPLKPRPNKRQSLQQKSSSPPSSLYRGRTRMSQLPSGGTFGRHSPGFVDITMPDSFHSLPSRRHSHQEKENDASLPHRRSKSSSRSSHKRSVRSLDHFTSSISDNHSTKTPVRSLSPSTRTPSTRSSKYRSAIISTPSTHNRQLDSPRTFGYPTPPSTRVPALNAVDFSPPPLPPLDHPELTTSFTFGKPVRPYSSMPQVQTVFPQTESDHGLSRGSSRRRANTMSNASTKTSRRSSAEWSANQASFNPASWPAEVSREILRLSIGHQDPGDGRRSQLLPPDNDNETFSAVPYSPSLGSPIFLQGGALSNLTLSTSARDHIATSGENKANMSQKDTSVPAVSNGQPGASSKGKKAPLRSSLRMNSSSALRSNNAKSNASGSHLDLTNATPVNSKGKRKADEVDLTEITPPDQKSIHAKFLVPDDRLTHRTSSDPHAPSSYRVKRARIDATTPTPSPSRPESSTNAANTGSWTSVRPVSRQPSINSTPTKKQVSRSGSVASNMPESLGRGTPRPRSMSSMSHMSIPLSALVSPHAPSVSRSLNAGYHMRDPRKPAKTHSTPWNLRFRTEAEDGSPMHAWCFFIGFVIFPAWWVASVWGIPQTRRVGEEDMEKGVTLDDPQVEHDARSWRFRCRIMFAISIFTYVPFIVLVAIFAPR